MFFCSIFVLVDIEYGFALSALASVKTPLNKLRRDWLDTSKYSNPWCRIGRSLIPRDDLPESILTQVFEAGTSVACNGT
jgi:hypothetical protein